MVISDGIPVVPRNRKSRNSVPNPSAEEKTTRNSVPWNKNRSNLPSFCGWENNSELGCPRNSADTEFPGIFWLLKWFLRNSGEIPRNSAEFRGISPELHRKSLPYSAECQNVTSVDTLLGIPFRGTKIEENSRNSGPNYSAEENTIRNSFPCNKKEKQSVGMPFWTIPWKRTNSEQNVAAEYFKNSIRKDSLGSWMKTKPMVISSSLPPPSTAYKLCTTAFP